MQDTSVMLAYYFGGKQYAADTAFSENGTFIFKGNETLDGGMYMIVLPNQKYFDLVISEQQFSFKTNINSLVESMEFTNSKGVMTRPMWTPMHTLPMYKDCQHSDLSISDVIEARMVNIPSSVVR